ncbi:hypothetical protein, partial [Myxococcus sp. AS-1-15]|uniref:hypothetical protein n=1 Tax=Myxococcus sp. AS-1-15 TaxID=2874600 RepID=UPI001CC1236B
MSAARKARKEPSLRTQVARRRQPRELRGRGGRLVVQDAQEELSPREKAIRQRLKDDFPHYAEKCLRIRPKEVSGAELPRLKLNKAQLYLHERLEAQLRKTGR